MTSYPPPYAHDESKALYPTVPAGDPQMQQQQPPGVYYQPQGSPAIVAPPAPGQASVAYYPQAGGPYQQPQQLVIAQGPPAVVMQAPQQQRPSLVCHIILGVVSCICCCPCGFIALVLAGKALLATTTFDCHSTTVRPLYRLFALADKRRRRLSISVGDLSIKTRRCCLYSAC